MTSEITNTMIKNKILELRKDNPAITLKEIKDRLSLICSISTISNCLKKEKTQTSKETNNCFKTGDKTRVFEKILIHIKQFKYIVIDGIEEKFFLTIVQDLKTGMILSSFSLSKSSEISAVFSDYIISTLKNHNYKIKEIITSKNRFYYSSDKENCNDFELIVSSKHKLQHNPLSNKDRIIEKRLYSNDILKTFNNTKAFENNFEVIATIFSNQILHNVALLQTSDLPPKELKKLREITMLFQPLCLDDYLLDMLKIKTTYDFWQTIEYVKTDDLHAKVIDSWEEEGDNLPQNKNSKELKSHYYNMSLELITYTKTKRFHAQKSLLLIKTGMICIQNGNGKEAKKLYKKALEIAEAADHKLQIANASYFYGDQLHQNGKRKQARFHYERALQIFSENKDKRRMCIVLGLLSTLMNDMRKYSKGMNYAQEMLINAQEVNDKLQETIAHNKLANTYRNIQEYEKALKIYNDRLTFALETKDHYLTSVIYGNISNIYSETKDYQQALKYQALQLQSARKIGQKILKAKGVSGTGNIYFKQGDIDKAIKSYSEALAIFKKLNIKKEIYNCCIQLGDLCKSKGSKRLTQKYYQELIDIADIIGDRNLIIKAKERMENRLY